MTDIEKILSDTEHRPFELPTGKWAYYQEWNQALFLHWKAPLETLQKLLPKDLHIDTFNGDAYVSLVAFTMQKIRPKNLPSVKFISDFGEINLRTYIENNNKKGVYFLNIEAEKQLAALISKTLSGLPYEKSNIVKSAQNFQSNNPEKNFYLNTKFEIKEMLSHKNELDKWLTERYCLYLENNGEIFSYNIHHSEWEIKNVKIKHLDLKYQIADLSLNNNPDLIHYSDGVKVLAWKKKKI